MGWFEWSWWTSEYRGIHIQSNIT